MPQHEQSNIAAGQLNNIEFITQFENQSLNPMHFNHEGHLRLTWIYLHQHDLEVAIAKVCTGIKAYAESLGASMKFHRTITEAMVRIMAGRVENLGAADWQLFLAQNQDLVNDAISVLEEYYSKALLFSDEARVTRMTPDIKTI